MSSAKALVMSLNQTAAELADLHAKMTPAPWRRTRTGGSVGDIPETIQVETGKDRWVAFPNEEDAFLEKFDVEGTEAEVHVFPDEVYKRIHPDAAGIAECRNRLEGLVALLRLAAAELNRLTQTT